MLNQMKKLNVADWISCSRMIAAPLVIATALLGLKFETGMIMLIGMATDYLDGKAARYFKVSSKMGSRLDSIGDAVLLLAGFFSVVLFYPEFIQAHIWETWILMILYLLQPVVSFIKFRRETAFHTYSAKLSALTASLFIIACFFYEPNELLFYIAWVVGMIEQIDELALLFIISELKEDIKGVYWFLKDK